MLKNQLFGYLLAPLAALLPLAVHGQAPDGNRSLSQQLVAEFERKAPSPGDMLPDVQAYDASGKPFHFGQLKGDYTVLVFGCLT